MKLLSNSDVAPRCRRGISLMEVLVALAIISLLLGITVPAVLSSRAAARRIHCTVNLKQLGLAIHSYESQYTVYPLGWTHKYQLLPYIEQSAIYQIPLLSSNLPLERWSPIEHFVIALYLCPEDPAPNSFSNGIVRTWGATSYAACAGTGIQRDGFNGIFNLGFNYGPRFPGGFVRAADVIDGLSNTAAMSEILHANSTFQRLRAVWNTPMTLAAQDELDQFADTCSSIPPNPTDYGWRGNGMIRGVPWYNGSLGQGMYNHVIEPNRPSCTNGTAVQLGAYTAASSHQGGVNVLFGDGHVTFCASQTDREVWREMGSRIKRNMNDSN